MMQVEIKGEHSEATVFSGQRITTEERVKRGNQKNSPKGDGQ